MAMTQDGMLGRARGALRSRDFALLATGKYASQFGDGLFQAFIFARLVFLNTDKQGTAILIAKAVALLTVPYSLIGPFAGVFIDRWSRRLILVWTPVLKAACLVPLLFVNGTAAIYALTLVCVSSNRFYLTTAGAVTPMLLRDEDLLVGNAMVGAGGTLVTAAGLAIGTRIAGLYTHDAPPRALLFASIALWAVASGVAVTIRNRMRAERPEARIRDDLVRVIREFVSGARRMGATPPAFASVTSVFYDQLLINTIAFLSVVVFKEQFKEGIASYSNIVVAAGFGLLIGMGTVGLLEPHLNRQRIIAVAFGVVGVSSILVAFHIVGITILLLTVILAATFVWRKTPADTMVQESLPDRFRGRTFAIQDIAFTMPRVIGALLLALALNVLHASTATVVVITGVLFLVWPPVFLAWVRRPRYVRLRFHEAGRAETTPIAVVVGGEEERVDLLGSALIDRDGSRLRRYRLRASDETLEVTAAEGATRWRVEHEVPTDIAT